MVNFGELPLGEKIYNELKDLHIDFAFQPIFDNKSLKVSGYEALMRPLGKSPLELIDEYKMKDSLHALELATFIGGSKAFLDRGYKGYVSMNSFPAECFNEDESEAFFRCFPEMAEKLFVEILENTEVDYDKWLLKKSQIKQNNMRILLDDYGSGKNHKMAVDIFNPETIKIDRSLIKGINLDLDRQDHVKELIDDFHGQNRYVVAEGVETKEEFEFFRETDVDFLQGYYLGRPE